MKVFRANGHQIKIEQEKGIYEYEKSFRGYMQAGNISPVK